MTELSHVAAPFRVCYIKLSQAKACGYRKKRKESLTKINSFREGFIKKEGEMKADLEEAIRSWRGLSERFKWWQKQEIP
jgi:hypothetical protein